MERELNHLPRFMEAAVAYKKKIGFNGTFLIEPKPQEPTKHQYDWDAATTTNFLRKYGLVDISIKYILWHLIVHSWYFICADEFKLNIECNHATLSGHRFVNVSIPLILQANPIVDPATATATATETKPSPEIKGFFQNCGSTEDVEIGQLKYVSDGSFISSENTKIAVIDEPNVLPILFTVRYIPDKATKKKCYTFPVVKGVKHLVKTIYYYGHFDGGTSPSPFFYFIIDGMKWSTVDTTEDFSNGLASYYEIILKARDERLHVFLAYNEKTVSSPFI